MTILEKAKELGREPEYGSRNWKRLTGGLTRTQVLATYQIVSGSPAQPSFAQQSGVKPTEEQIADYQ